MSKLHPLPTPHDSAAIESVARAVGEVTITASVAELPQNKFKDPTVYMDEPVCDRCGDGWPNCADKKPDGSFYSHT